MCVVIITLTLALTCHNIAVSATCWGSFTQSAHLLIVALPLWRVLLKETHSDHFKWKHWSISMFTSASLWGGLGWVMSFILYPANSWHNLISNGFVQKIPTLSYLCHRKMGIGDSIWSPQVIGCTSTSDRERKIPDLKYRSRWLHINRLTICESGCGCGAPEHVKRVMSRPGHNFRKQLRRKVVFMELTVGDKINCRPLCVLRLVP